MAATESAHSAELRGDETALYVEHADHLLAVVSKRCTCDRAHIEDACQFAWTQFLQHQPDRDHAFGWLVVTASREAWKSAGRERREFDYADGGTEPADDDLATRLRAREALAAVAGMGAAQRRVVQLKIAGYSYVEIAERLGVTRTYVNRHLTRGRAALRAGA